MRPKQQEQRKYSIATNILRFGLPIMATAYLLLRWYDLCQSEEELEENAVVSGGDYAALGAFLCPLYTLMKSSKQTIIDALVDNSNSKQSCQSTFPVFKDAPPNAVETCIGSVEGPQMLPYDGDIFLARTPKDVEDAKKRGARLTDRFSEFKNTIFHFQIMNHYYDRLLEIYHSLSAEDIAELSVAVDTRRRTAFHLSVIVAPGEVQRTLMNENNVMLADMYGVTPLMLAAAGFMNLQTTLHLLCLIGEDRLAEALAAKDYKNRTFEGYSKMSLNQITGYLRNFEINPDKVSNHCYDTFYAADPLCMPPEMDRTELAAVLQMDPVMTAGEKIYCVTATEKNIKTIANLEGGGSKNYWNEAKKLLPRMSNETLAGAIKNRQTANRAAIEEKIQAVAKKHSSKMKAKAH